MDAAVDKVVNETGEDIVLLAREISGVGHTAVDVFIVGSAGPSQEKNGKEETGGKLSGDEGEPATEFIGGSAGRSQENKG